MVFEAEWTADKVVQQLIRAFRKMPDAPIMARGGELVPPTGFAPIEGLELIRATLMVLGPRSEAAKALLAVARAQAKGLSLRELCHEQGWSRSTLYRHRDAASADVAAYLNHRALSAADGGTPDRAAGRPQENGGR
jgi:hypothetical protein